MHIPPHTGPSNDQLRVHLSLVHTGGARIRVEKLARKGKSSF